MKLLYLTFINLEDTPKSGSSVRPLKMKQAFEELEAEVMTVDGMNNDLKARRNAVAKAKEIIESWKPDMCYIEPPSGPMFYFRDIGLIKLLHKQKIPTSIFYRDAYWKYPDFAGGKKKSLTDRLKDFVIRRMQIHQWHVFSKNLDIIYFPSMTMAKEFMCPRKDALPPGGFVPDFQEKTELSDPLQFIFVGGASKNYGVFLTIDAFAELNKAGVKAKLYYICPEEQWNSLGIDKEQYRDWLEVVHTSGDENLKPYYEKADMALLTAPRSFYRDFAVPIKIFEYISYLKPVLVTNCTETERIVKENRTGWVVEDNAESIADKLQYLYNHPDEVKDIRDGMKNARSRNLWVSRAEKVIADLEKIRADRA
ncbi:MAG: glycosyltransferase [Clostridia bacterium]|nr:glycosyltransferase [Clostridia bacterium]MBQ6720522.1 glycosyltransferase [Clostridia bacterium]